MQDRTLSREIDDVGKTRLKAQHFTVYGEAPAVDSTHAVEALRKLLHHQCLLMQRDTQIFVFGNPVKIVANTIDVVAAAG